MKNKLKYFIVSIVLSYPSVYAVYAMGVAPDLYAVRYLDEAPLVVNGRIIQMDNKTGQGILRIDAVLKGRLSLKHVKIQASGAPRPHGYVKYAQPPRYEHHKGESGVYLFFKHDKEGRYDLRRHGAYYAKQWLRWVKEKLEFLKSRPWSEPVNGIKGSVLVGDGARNTAYRYFFLCLQNDSDKDQYIRLNFRLHATDKAHNLYEAKITTPDGLVMDLIEGYRSGKNRASFSGMAGWLLSKNDFYKLPAGKRLYLPVHSSMFAFLPVAVEGDYVFKAEYKNQIDAKEFGLQGVWTGLIDFPPVRFTMVPSP